MLLSIILKIYWFPFIKIKRNKKTPFGEKEFLLTRGSVKNKKIKIDFGGYIDLFNQIRFQRYSTIKG